MPSQISPAGPSSQPQFSQPPSGFVKLILVPGEDPFYLEIPIVIVEEVCLKPLKYLRYLGWCVLGVVGTLCNEQGNEITLEALDGTLANQGVYRYEVEGQTTEAILAHAIDLEVIKLQTHELSETTGTHEDFRRRLEERDFCCVWSGLDAPGMHIIPHRRGDEARPHFSCFDMRTKFSTLLQWLRLIVNNRPHTDNLDSLTINDIRNGFLCTDSLRNPYFYPRHIVVLKVCASFPSELSPLNSMSDTEYYPGNC